MTRFSEWVSAMSPTQFTELALLLFTVVFVAVVARELTKGRRLSHAAWAALPLEDDVRVVHDVRDRGAP